MTELDKIIENIKNVKSFLIREQQYELAYQAREIEKYLLKLKDK